MSNDKLEFKRLQRLRFGGKPLIGIVYLPAQGAPIVLCIIRNNDKSDDRVVMQQLAGTRVATWPPAMPIRYSQPGSPIMPPPSP